MKLAFEEKYVEVYLPSFRKNTFQDNLPSLRKTTFQDNEGDVSRGAVGWPALVLARVVDHHPENFTFWQVLGNPWCTSGLNKVAFPSTDKS